MNVFSLISSVSTVFQRGKSINGSTLLTNVEAGAIMLYDFLSALVLVLHDLGINVTVGSTDLHTVSSGWAITITFIYGIYRIATNPNTGFKNGARNDKVG